MASSDLLDANLLKFLDTTGFIVVGKGICDWELEEQWLVERGLDGLSARLN
jgi:hypothetical protein